MPSFAKYHENIRVRRDPSVEAASTLGCSSDLGSDVRERHALTRAP